MGEGTARRISRRRFLRTAVALGAGTTAMGIGGGLYSVGIEPFGVEVTHIRLSLPRLAPAFNGYRLVQISDIHLDDMVMTHARLREIVALANAQQPDAIVITGDFVTMFTPGSQAAYMANLTDALRMLRAADGPFAVLGNHDHWSNPYLIRGMLEQAGVHNLSNAAHTLRRGEAMFHLAGVDDVWEQQDRLDDVLDVLPDEGAAILLAHEPDFADDSAVTGRFDLQLSGHSHGGQVNLPLFGRPRLPRLGIKYPAGLYQVQSMLLYTNRGLGVVWPRVRFNCRPELTVFTLESV